jgi:hypothetical protein
MVLKKGFKNSIIAKDAWFKSSRAIIVFDEDVLISNSSSNLDLTRTNSKCHSFFLE